MRSAPHRRAEEAIRAAAERLSERLQYRDAQVIDPSQATALVPRWWRTCLAACRIFGDGHMSWSSPDEGPFSRAVTLFDGSEISVSAGGEFLPFAWIDGGVEVAIVATRAVGAAAGGPGPVFVGPPDGARPPRAMADSLVAFLDALQPQTLCLLAGPTGRRRVEICGERTLRIERAGRIHTEAFASDDEVGRYVGRFLSDGIDDGLRVVTCPARMRPLVAGYAGEVAKARAVAPEVRADQVIKRLLADELLEFIEDTDVEQFIDEAARFMEKEGATFLPSGRPSDRFARRFISWLLGHRAVDDLYADDEQVALAFLPPERGDSGR